VPELPGARFFCWCVVSFAVYGCFHVRDYVRDYLRFHLRFHVRFLACGSFCQDSRLNPPRALAIWGFSIMFLLYTGSGLAGPGCMLVPRLGAPTGVASEIACFVDQRENRDLISRALGAQLPNPGSVSLPRGRCNFLMFRLALVLLGVILQRCHLGLDGGHVLDSVRF
jgi:hypothetical protein